MNLTTWLRYLSTLPPILKDFSNHQTNVLNAQINREIYTSTVDNLVNDLHPLAFATGKSENDVFHLGQMLKQHDKNDFIRAMEKEINGHREGKHFDIVRKSDTIGTIIKSTWSFKLKRDSSGSLTKHKARTCAHGGMQRWGEGCYEIYAPVVNWLCIRFLLTMSVALTLDTRSIDFTMACPQADLKISVHMETPWGYEIEGEDHSSMLHEVTHELVWSQGWRPKLF